MRRLAVNGSPAIFPRESLVAVVPAGAPGDAADADDDEASPPIMDVTVAPPALLRWSPTSHSRFPRAFRSSARELIMSHARLSDEPGTLGILPFALRDAIVELLAPPVPDWKPIESPRPETPPPA